MNKNKWFLNGGRGSGRAIRLLCETYENKIADLEKENAELRNNGFTVSAMTEQQLKVALEKGEQLEKENAELKKELGITRRCWYDQKNISLDTNCKLHKAKELLKQWLQANICDSVVLFSDTEQFISEVEK